jgi:hypothetical protein
MASAGIARAEHVWPVVRSRWHELCGVRGEGRGGVWRVSTRTRNHEGHLLCSTSDSKEMILYESGTSLRDGYSTRAPPKRPGWMGTLAGDQGWDWFLRAVQDLGCKSLGWEVSLEMKS